MTSPEARIDRYADRLLERYLVAIEETETDDYEEPEPCQCRECRTLRAARAKARGEA